MQPEGPGTLRGQSLGSLVWSEDAGPSAGRQSWSVRYGLRVQNCVQVSRAGPPSTA